MTTHNRRILSAFLTALSLILFSCSREAELVERMDQIKNEVAETDAKEALRQLDALEHYVFGESKYVQNRYQLLKIRLSSKAGIELEQDRNVQPMVDYFERHGNNNERQEAHYYAGIVYRDLQDTPRALEHFLKSAAIAHTSGNCDSLLLRNAYSNLHYLYNMVQNHKEAFTMARNEYAIAQQMNDLDEATIENVGVALYNLDSLEAAAKYFNRALRFVKENKESRSEDAVSTLLFYFSRLGLVDQARQCRNMLRRMINEHPSAKQCIALGDYYWMQDELDSAVRYFGLAMEIDDHNLLTLSDATKCLYNIYKQMGERDMAYKYADMHIVINNDLDYGRLQELASTANNQYKYQRDQQEEQLERIANDRRMHWTAVICLLLIIITSSVFCALLYRKNRRLRRLLMRVDTMQNVMSENQKVSSELSSVTHQLEQMAGQLGDRDKLLEQMADKIKRQKVHIDQLQQSGDETDETTTHNLLTRAGDGIYAMTDADWSRLIRLHERTHPRFHDRLLELCPGITPKQQRMCHLLLCDISYGRMATILDCPKSTIYNWKEKYQCVVEKILATPSLPT